MQTTHHHRRDTFLRMKEFADSHTDIPAGTLWSQLLTELNTVNAYFDSHAAAETAHDGAKLQHRPARRRPHRAARADDRLGTHRARMLTKVETQRRLHDPLTGLANRVMLSAQL